MCEAPPRALSGNQASDRDAGVGIQIEESDKQEEKEKEGILGGQVRGVSPGAVSPEMEKVYQDSNVHTEENEGSQEQMLSPQVRRQPPPPPPYFERGKLEKHKGEVTFQSIVSGEWREKGMMKCEMEKERYSDLVQIKEYRVSENHSGCQCSQGRRKRRIVKNRRTDESEVVDESEVKLEAIKESDEEEAKACVCIVQENSRNEGTGTTKAYVDSGASAHMFNSISLFEKINEEKRVKLTTACDKEKTACTGELRSLNQGQGV